MNRRSFFRNFGGLIAAVAISQKVVLDFTRSVFSWNPAYVDTPYEGAWLLSDPRQFCNIVPVVFPEGDCRLFMKTSFWSG